MLDRHVNEGKTNRSSPPNARFLWTVASLLIIVPLGLYSKFYSGPAANWVNNSLGGVFYEVFWCLLIFLFADKPWVIAISACCHLLSGVSATVASPLPGTPEKQLHRQDDSGYVVHVV